MELSLTPEQKEASLKIFDYLRIEDPIKKADVIFAAGGSITNAADKAAELFFQGMSGHIAYIANKGTYSGPQWPSDAEGFHDRFLELKVPEDKMLWKPIANNTLEEAQMLLPFLEKHGIVPHSVLLTTRPFHQRRVFATFKKIYKNIELINQPAYEEIVFTDVFVARLIGETDRLQKYADKGDIFPQDIPQEILDAANLLRSSLSLPLR